jgi:protein-disulfide isomerase
MKKELTIPIAILFAGIIISIAIFVTHPHIALSPNGNPDAVRPIDTSDHFLGNPAAPVILIEYSDVDSEYSKNFQKVMEQVMQDYGANGNVAWVYRDLPIGDQDVNSEKHDEAAECVASIGKPSDFFAFIDAMQLAAPGDSLFDPTNYDSLVSTLGLSTGSFDSCMTAHTYQSKVAADYKNAQEIGATGTPYNIILIKGQKPLVISGSIPYTTMKKVLDTSIAKALAQ